MKTTSPLQLIICQHKKNTQATELVEMINLALRGNLSGANPYIATLSDQAIPYRHFTECTDTLGLDLIHAAEHSLVVVLADSVMCESSEWIEWLLTLSSENNPSMSAHEVVILTIGDKTKELLGSKINLDDYTALGIDDQEKDKTLTFGEHAEQSTWFALYVLQACRRLLTQNLYSEDDPKQKLKLFINHAKKDSLPLANSIRSAIKSKRFLSHWYDADDLAKRPDWRQAIREGAESSVVIVLRTEEYDKRPWCRQEFLWAEQCGVPIVSIEARNVLEISADSLASHRVPAVRIPDGNLFRVLFIALKESLRILQLESVVKRLKLSNELFQDASQVKLIPYTPTLKHLAHISDELRTEVTDQSRGDYHMIVHADPPLPTELYQACKSFIEQRAKCRTYIFTMSLLPFMRKDLKHPDQEIVTGSLKSKALQKKLKVNLSVSESVKDFDRLGISIQTVHDFTVNIAQSIMANEGILVLGHDWRKDGIMDEMTRFAEEHQDVIIHEDKREGMIENHLFWGSKTSLESFQQTQLKGLIDIIKGGKPNDPILTEYNQLFGSNLPSELQKFAFARSLSVMREKMTQECIARICIGGKDMDLSKPEKGPNGRCPGVAEEAYLSCLHGQPLYISGILGGVSEQIALALDGKEASLDFELPEEAKTKYLSEENQQHISTNQQYLNSKDLIQYFKEFGVEKLSKINGLTKEENQALFYAKTIDEVRQLCLIGLARIVALHI